MYFARICKLGPPVSPQQHWAELITALKKHCHLITCMLHNSPLQLFIEHWVMETNKNTGDRWSNAHADCCISLHFQATSLSLCLSLSDSTGTATCEWCPLPQLRAVGRRQSVWRLWCPLQDKGNLAGCWAAAGSNSRCLLDLSLSALRSSVAVCVWERLQFEVSERSARSSKTRTTQTTHRVASAATKEDQNRGWHTRCAYADFMTS